MQARLVERMMLEAIGAWLPLLFGGLALLWIEGSIGELWSWIAHAILMPPAVVMSIGVFRELSRSPARVTPTQVGFLSIMSFSAVILFIVATLPDRVWASDINPNPNVLGWSSLVLFALVTMQCWFCTATTGKGRTP